MLPKTSADFKSKEFWDKFFAKRGDEPFEWYGSYSFYQPILTKELPTKSRILMLGCGNSLMSEQMYDAGYSQITSIDYSEKTIAKMDARKKDRKLAYSVMDITNLKFPNDSFDAVIDKATLDAMMTDETVDCIELVHKMWDNAIKVLANKGKYICITLLQQHILSKVLSYFLNGNFNPHYSDRAFIMRVYEAEIDPTNPERHIPFVLVLEQTKLDPAQPTSAKIKEMFSKTVYYISNGKMESLTIDGLIMRVKERQMYGYVTYQSQSFQKGQRFKIECYDPNSKLQIPKYILTVVDAKKDKVLKSKKVGVFIAPLGRENDYLFATEEGNFYLQSDSNYSRLIIVTLNHKHNFGTMEEIQQELNPKVMTLVPKDCVNVDKIPYLRIGENIGKRETIYNDKGILIEDVEDFDGAIIRRLFFESKIEEIQSEANLKLVPKSSPEATPDVLTKSLLFPEDSKKPEVVILNHTVLCSDYARAIVSGLSAIVNVITNKPEFKITILGTGAGVLPMFFKHNFKNSVVQTVDIDSEMLKLGELYYGFRPDGKNLISHCMDAFEFMKQIYARKEANPYDLIIIDLNNPDLSTGISPDTRFYSNDFLQEIKVFFPYKTNINRKILEIMNL